MPTLANPMPMKAGPLLITSFLPWRSHQPSNASDDLVDYLHQHRQLPPNALWLRHLPVNFELAPIQVISALYQAKPKTVVCCGMAENRQYLSLEKQARGSQTILKTSLNLPALLAGTRCSEISYDAGSYVCNHLYFCVLDYIRQRNLSTQCLFVHVPKLHPSNLRTIATDFSSILARTDPMDGPHKIPSNG